MGRKAATLGDEITRDLITPKNKDVDIETEDFGGSSDESLSEDETEHYVKVGQSKLRNGVKLGGKYKGAAVSRDELYGEDDDEDELLEEKEDEEDEEDEDEDEEDEDEDEEDSDDSDDADDADDAEDQEASADSDEDILADVTDSSEDELLSEDENEDQTGDESEEEAESDDMEESEQYKRAQLGKLLAQEKKKIIGRLSTSAKTDAIKGYSILQQQRLFDKILDGRIKIQKAVTASNELPVDKAAYEAAEKSEETASKLKQVKSAVNELLDSILAARSKLYKRDFIGDAPYKQGKKRSLADYSGESEKMDEVLKSYRKSTLVKWSNKVQSASGASALSKLNVINQNVYTQLQNTMQDMERLVKRTRLNRRRVTPIGYDEKIKERADNSDSDDDDDDDEEEEDVPVYQSKIDQSLQENAYIFDDDDFYRMLLNDMVDKKILDKQAATSAAIITLSKSKMHKNYERMATKGRKLKYTVQESLRNFEAPVATSYLWNDDQIDELFASLLGQKVSMAEVSDSEEEDEEKAEEVGALKSSSLKLFG